MRIAVIDRTKCTKEKCGYQCARVCPGVRMGEETITKDEEGFPVISEILCTGCGICPKKCPVDAIKIINLKGEVGQLILQYGVNSFRLYNLPLPRNAVVGLIGANGIGKTTALNILSGKIVPNLGDYSKKQIQSELVKKIKGQDLINYFSNFSGRKISYKPQNVDRIPDVFKGKVSELLKKADERKILKQAVKEFELEECFEREIASLSGGELQRVAICAAYLKDADIYFFDEPSSYLDIEQRLKIGKKIKELAEKKAVLVVEHDLALLDYLSEYVHVLFGVPGAYGVVSSLKNVRSGINEYLEGYLREENIRFREYEIKFQILSAEDSGGRQEAFEWPELEKSYSAFKLKCEAGKLKKGEIIGIVGPNAIGKSTFAKMIAGIEEPSKGEVPHKLKISYKPQYVKSDFGGSVAELIAKSGIDRGIFERDVKERLEIENLMEKQVAHLSGGELQRVSIAICLSQEADIYLLDEPSAFLDIEQRLNFADVARKIIEGSDKQALIIDHDLVLIDSVSHRLMVFEGNSSIQGHARAPESKRSGMNRFLKKMEITLRRDKDSKRPRVNKQDSSLDREQKTAGEYYYYEKK